MTTLPSMVGLPHPASKLLYNPLLRSGESRGEENKSGREAKQIAQRPSSYYRIGRRIGHLPLVPPTKPAKES